MPSVIELGPVGYGRLRERHSLKCLPNYVESVVSYGTRHTHSESSIVRETYPKAYWPGEGDFAQLEFALKREGVHLQLLREMLPKLSAEDLTAFVRSKPTGANTRRIWLLYEEFTGKRVEALPDVLQGNYVDLLNTKQYYTGQTIRSPRHRVNINLPGNFEFCPIVRRTEILKTFRAKQLAKRCQKVLDEIPPEIYSRALQYLYRKETKSSYAIERETPDQKRTRTFSDALKEASQKDYLLKKNLVALQQMIVDPRYVDKGWRDEQIYVGRSISYTDEEVHFVAPRPQEIVELMSAFLKASRRILNSEMDPVVAAAVISYAFVFLHPFSDGNGRVHRFLIHYVLTQSGFAPEGVVFPVSAIMLHRIADYDASLESFSKPLLPLVDYELDSVGRMTVNNDTRDFYRYIDFTKPVEALYSFVEDTIEKELPSEVRFLRQYDEARRLMRDVVDLPNRHADLFVRLCLQNDGKLSKAKRGLREFQPLSDEEISGLEDAVNGAYSSKKEG
ncbi:MAG: Fic family protein [Verrucomicrobia bacterium]|jgi:hypothetical protein|nr:Fic family protein [Verrucomicrobiota bacterium]